MLGSSPIYGLGGDEKDRSKLPSLLPSFLPRCLTFIFVSLMHADLKEGIGKDSLPNKTKHNKQKRKLL